MTQEVGKSREVRALVIVGEKPKICLEEDIFGFHEEELQEQYDVSQTNDYSRVALEDEEVKMEFCLRNLNLTAQNI